MINFQSALEVGKNLAAAAGISGVLWSAYAVSGLPVPATLHQVEQRINAVSKRIDNLSIDQLQGQRSVIRLTRVSLRNEQTALQRILEGGPDISAKSTLTRRLGEISDQLAELDASDQELRQRIHKLQG